MAQIRFVGTVDSINASRALIAEPGIGGATCWRTVRSGRASIADLRVGQTVFIRGTERQAPGGLTVSANHISARSHA